MVKEALRIRWKELQTADSKPPQQRGYDLEVLLADLAAAEKMEYRRSYRLAGEQIDGLIGLDGRFLLVEAKWVADKVGASEVYAFRAKVDGKLSGTLGVFIAVNGFQDTVPDVLRYGKDINVLLMDGDDIELALQEDHTLADVIRAKLRRAAQYGEVYYRYQRYLDEQEL